MTVSGVFGVFWQAIKAWVNDRASSAGAALAWYSVFSLAPLLLLVILLTGFIIGEQKAEEVAATQVKDFVGEEGAKAVEGMLKAAHKPGAGLVASITGWAMLIFGAIGLLMELQDSLNTIWKVDTGKRTLLGTLRARLLTFSLVLATALLLVASLVTSAAIAVFSNRVPPVIDPGIVGKLTDWFVTFAISTVLFAVIFRLLPEVEVAWADVWLGAAVTGVLFTFGKSLIAWYLGQAAVASAFGAAGSLAVLLVWLYYSAQIFLFGAEFTKAFADRYGSRIGSGGTTAM